MDVVMDMDVNGYVNEFGDQWTWVVIQWVGGYIWGLWIGVYSTPNSRLTYSIQLFPAWGSGILLEFINCRIDCCFCFSSCRQWMQI